MIEILKVDLENELDDLHYVIATSFKTVAQDFCLTEENAPTNPAFISPETLRESINKNVTFFASKEGGVLNGCVGIAPGKQKNEYYIERLAVLPQHRHIGVGQMLLNRAIKEIQKLGGRFISIGIIDENKTLKDWYIRHGFVETGLKRFPHLPFTVCFMQYGGSRDLRE